MWISNADKARLHVLVHAIGDRANTTLLDIYERVARENGARDRRFRIEHAQHLSPADIPRFGALGVIASMQPSRHRRRAVGGQRHRSAHQDNDVPIAARQPCDAGVRQRLVRRPADAARGHLRPRHAPHAGRPQPRRLGLRAEDLGRSGASLPTLRGGALASFEEREKGMISPGMLADLVVIDRDLRDVPPREIRDARVTRTIVAGRTVFR